MEGTEAGKSEARGAKSEIARDPEGAEPDPSLSSTRSVEGALTTDTADDAERHPVPCSSPLRGARRVEPLITSSLRERWCTSEEGVDEVCDKDSDKGREQGELSREGTVAIGKHSCASL